MKILSSANPNAIVGGTFRAADNHARVFPVWERNDGGARLVALQPVALGELLRGEWETAGFTLVSFSRA